MWIRLLFTLGSDLHGELVVRCMESFGVTFRHRTSSNALYETAVVHGVLEWWMGLHEMGWVGMGL